MTGSLRFCMVTTFYPPYSFGGDATFVYRLSNELARRGHHVEVIHSVDAYRALGGPPPKSAVTNHEKVRVHSLRSRAGILSLLLTHQTGYPWLQAGEIRRILGDPGWDVIHFHNISLVGGPGILAFGNAIKLYTMHEHWLICPTHVLFKFNREPCVKKQCLACTLVHRRPPQLWRYSGLLRQALRHVDAFISPSRFTLERHRADGLDLPMVHLPYFLTPAEEPGGEEVPDRPPIHPRPFFLFVGRLEKLKGLQHLIPIFRDYPQADLLVAGDGGYAPQLRAMAADVPRVRFLGRLGQGDLRALYREAIALLVPSITYEVFGQVILEAFVHRTPVIVNALGALPEVVEESGGGLVYATPEELVVAMRRLQGNPAFRRALGGRGYAAYRTKWTAEVCLPRYLDLIRRIAARKRGAGEPVGAVS